MLPSYFVPSCNRSTNAMDDSRMIARTLADLY